jgi:hypothetical protein
MLRDELDLIGDESVVGGRDEHYLVRGNALARGDGDQVHGHEEQNEGGQDFEPAQREAARRAIPAVCHLAFK